MIRLHFVVEGLTEEAFVRDVLGLHLATYGVFCDGRSVETSRRGGKVYRGGLRTYAHPRSDLLRWMKQDQKPEARFTTMFDLYRLPGDFPGYAEARALSAPRERVLRLEGAFGKDIGDPRFVPHIQLHEFEALLFACPEAMGWYFPGQHAAIRRLVSLAEGFASPEEIDDGAETAPSKRISREIPPYADLKPTAGPLIAAQIGLPTMREKCRHFHEWLCRLEALGGASPPKAA